MTSQAKDVLILSKSNYRAAKEYDCAWANHTPHKIAKGRPYVRVVYEDKNGKLQSDHVCLDCWAGDYAKANLTPGQDY